MLDRDNLLGFALLAMDMRDRQKVYHKTRTQSAMIVMWEAQKLFDRRRKELFGSPDEPNKPEEPKAE